jgi:hypothetical protein
MILICASARAGPTSEPEACTVIGIETGTNTHGLLDPGDWADYNFPGDSIVDRWGWDIKVCLAQGSWTCSVEIFFYNLNQTWEPAVLGRAWLFPDTYIWVDFPGFACPSKNWTHNVRIKNTGTGAIGITEVQNYGCVKAQSTGAVTLAGGTEVPPLDDGPESCGDPGGSAIPNLSEWAMIIFSVLLLGMMTYYVVRRRRVAHSEAM